MVYIVNYFQNIWSKMINKALKLNRQKFSSADKILKYKIKA